ncbi:MAG: antibiotic biosynthesis monooxygenase [Chitinophagales bacterium]|nr:antibiotic biosynthesis monooxygenase [Chitinophagales bacterium]
MSKEKNFVAINYITCKDHYKERFEELFASRKGAIDKMPGFQEMEVLKPMSDEGETVYLIMSHWESEDAFKDWTKSEAFLEGHKRGFEDLKQAKMRGEEAPMSSSFKTYEVISR